MLHVEQFSAGPVVDPVCWEASEHLLGGPAPASGAAFGDEDLSRYPMLARLPGLFGAAVVGAGAERELPEVHDVGDLAGARGDAVSPARRTLYLVAALAEEADAPGDAGGWWCGCAILSGGHEVIPSWSGLRGGLSHTPAGPICYLTP